MMPTMPESGQTRRPAVPRGTVDSAGTAVVDRHLWAEHADTGSLPPAGAAADGAGRGGAAETTRPGAGTASRASVPEKRAGDPGRGPIVVRQACG